ncbi:unnamed protein product [Effrenium voratum]|nr:unnamed protein product [Effrenium voratum]
MSDGPERCGLQPALVEPKEILFFPESTNLLVQDMLARSLGLKRVKVTMTQICSAANLLEGLAKSDFALEREISFASLREPFQLAACQAWAGLTRETYELHGRVWQSFGTHMWRTQRRTSCLNRCAGVLDDSSVVAALQGSQQVTFAMKATL